MLATVTGALAVSLAIGQPAAANGAGTSGRPSGPASSTGSTSPTGSDSPTVFTGSLTSAQLSLLDSVGIDRHEDVVSTKRPDGRYAVEIVMSRQTARRLRRAGLELVEKTVDGAPVSRLLAEAAAPGPKVFRPWSGTSGLRAEYLAVAAAHPDLVKVVPIGRSVRGQQILAFKVTSKARSTTDGKRPAVLYLSAQHAREWITPEVTRRLFRHVVEGYATDRGTRDLLAGTELWFVPVANPDGYDYTFTPGNRLWRKNLRDNNGDGKITGEDGVDPNRNWRYTWGYDNEGSSPTPSSETYRGTAAGSEPETQALDQLMRRIRFAYSVNYHSAAELLLYGNSWQVATPEPDDAIFEALLGDRKKPAVRGFDPDPASELYTTNGSADDHWHTHYGTLALSPELSTCETASALDPKDAFTPANCQSVFSYPDSEPLVQAEFTKNLPLALAVARSARRPDQPVSVVGRKTPDFRPDTFSVSYGDPQTVAVTARRSLRRLTAHWSVNGGAARSATLRRWRGGERYGADGQTYYAEYRASVRGARPGDSVKVWFTGRSGSGSQARTRSSKPFTYRLVQDTPAKVLVLADEDITGVNPTYPAGTTGPKYAGGYRQALTTAGYSSTTYDIDRYGAPHPLGVLGHFRAVVWYLGDNRLTQDQRDTKVGQNLVRDVAVAERAAATTYAVRDYLNEGGKLVQTGETAGYYGTQPSNGGLWYGQDGNPSATCVQGGNSECLLLSDDFHQYYLGAAARVPTRQPTGFTTSSALRNAVGRFGGPAVAANPLDEAGAFAVTSDDLPASQFPMFASTAVAAYRGGANSFGAVSGSWARGLRHQDSSYSRLTRTIDLSAVPASATPTLSARLSVDAEPNYDHVIVEARTAGGQDWTTLPDLGGATTTAAPAECETGGLIGIHPALTHYLTVGTTCKASGTTGSWNAITGRTGWRQTRFDLSRWAGRSVEISISYVSDSAVGGLGLLVDDVDVLVGGRSTGVASFERGDDGWTAAAPPAGSPLPGRRFERLNGLVSAGVRTRDTVLLGFGVEQVATRTERAALLREALRSILR